MNNAKPLRTILLHAGALGDCTLAYHLARELVEDASRDLTMIARHPVHRWQARRNLIAESAFTDDCGITSLYADDFNPPVSLATCLKKCDLVINFLGPTGSTVDRNLRGQCGDRVISIDPQPDATDLHIVEQWRRRIVSQYETKSYPNEPIHFDPTTKRRCRESLAHRLGCGDRRISMIHPGSGGNRKCAPLEWFENAVTMLRDARWHVAWMIGPDELERDGPQFKSRLESTATVIAESNISDAADLLAGTDAFIGNDSGMAHVAALCGVKTLAWFGPTNPTVWRPLGPDVHILTDTDQQPFVQDISQLLLT